VCVCVCVCVCDTGGQIAGILCSLANVGRAYQDDIRRAGGIHVLGHILRSGDPQEAITQNAVAALCNLAYDNEVRDGSYGSAVHRRCNDDADALLLDNLYCTLNLPSVIELFRPSVLIIWGLTVVLLALYVCTPCV
jgi:hypothetical protein